MRKIKFRGKRLDNQKWVEGSLVDCIYRSFIKDINDKTTNPRQLDGANKTGDFRCVEVEPSTVGQFAGLKDKNGKEIWEGDVAIVNLKYFDIKNEKRKIIFKGGSFGVQHGYSDVYFKTFAAWDDIEVIGNIHDNPELLESEV